MLQIGALSERVLFKLLHFKIAVDAVCEYKTDFLHVAICVIVL